MKVLHIVMAQYSDGWTYQENMLAKFHKILGNDVTILTSKYCYNKGKLIKDTRDEFVDCNGCKVIRLEEITKGIAGKLPRFKNFYTSIENINPDIIFSHGVQYVDASKVCKYVRTHPKVVLYADNHADFSNSAKTWIKRYVLHGIIWRHYAKMVYKNCKKIYGVMPSRVDFLHDVYKLPHEKCELLVMGGDDEIIREALKENAIVSFRQKNGISKNDFLVVTGGKIDKAKQQTFSLMKAIQKIHRDNVKLIVFGDIDEELKDTAYELIDGNYVKYIGWLSGDDSYYAFAAADLVVFPGRHSVFWEETASLGIPMICKDWVGTHHVNVSNNVRFLTRGTENEITEQIQRLVDDDESYYQMKGAALSAASHFSYLSIAKKSIGIIEGQS